MKLSWTSGNFGWLECKYWPSKKFNEACRSSGCIILSVHRHWEGMIELNKLCVGTEPVGLTLLVGFTLGAKFKRAWLSQQPWSLLQGLLLQGGVLVLSNAVMHMLSYWPHCGYSFQRESVLLLAILQWEGEGCNEICGGLWHTHNLRDVLLLLQFHWRGQVKIALDSWLQIVNICLERSSYFKIVMKYPVVAFNALCSVEACFSYYCVAAFPEHMLS